MKFEEVHILFIFQKPKAIFLWQINYISTIHFPLNISFAKILAFCDSSLLISIKEM